jgi:hypothetical protein
MENFPDNCIDSLADGGSSNELLEYEVLSFVGFVGVPVGLVGNLRIMDIDEVSRIRNDFTIPQITSKETLAARCYYLYKTLGRCGIVQLFVIEGSNLRGPVFLFASPAEAILFAEHIPGLLNQFANEAQRFNPHIRLEKLTPYIAASNVLIDFDYFCSDPLDRHVVTIVLQTACYHFLQSNSAKELGVKGLIVTSEIKSIEAASLVRLKESQGMRAIDFGELGCSGECLYAVWKAMGKTRVYDKRRGSIFDTANSVPIFPACGHDPESVAEFAWNHLAIESGWERKISLLLSSQPEPAPRYRRHSWSS